MNNNKRTYLDFAGKIVRRLAGVINNGVILAFQDEVGVYSVRNIPPRVWEINWYLAWEKTGHLNRDFEIKRS